MSNMALVVGRSGSGKSTSLFGDKALGIEGLNPAETLIINITGKPLPMRGWRKVYTPLTKETGNYLETVNPDVIAAALDLFQKRADLKNVVIDDYQYVLADEYMTSTKQNFAKYDSIGKNAYQILRKLFLLKDKNVFVLTHIDYSKEDECYKVKTIGRMLDEKITIEGLFTVVLVSHQEVSNGKMDKYFITNYDGTYNLAKSPSTMFETTRIKNDLGLVLKDMTSYYEGE